MTGTAGEYVHAAMTAVFAAEYPNKEALFLATAREIGRLRRELGDEAWHAAVNEVLDHDEVNLGVRAASTERFTRMAQAAESPNPRRRARFWARQEAGRPFLTVFTGLGTDSSRSTAHLTLVDPAA